MSGGRSSRGRGQRSTHRRTGADRQGRERADEGVIGQACNRAPGGEKVEKEAGRGNSGHSANARSNSSRRGCPHRSVRRCGRRSRGRRAAGRRRGTRRWRTWSASAVSANPRSRGQTPSTSCRWGQGWEGRRARMDRRGREGCRADNPVVDHREGKGRQDRAAQQRRGASASGREGKRVGASALDVQAAQCRAGLQC